MKAKAEQVLIRMYGQGLGDCFLLTLPRTPSAYAAMDQGEDRPVHILIDCGVIAKASHAELRMREVVRDIRETTNDARLTGSDGMPKGHLDLLILTNGNPDHVSGFRDAMAEWGDIQVDAVWSAWTERDTDDVAGALRKVTTRQRQALTQLVGYSGRASLDEHLRIAVNIASVLADLPTADVNQDSSKLGMSTIGQIANERVPEGAKIFCEPGEVRWLPGTNALAYILGPPRDWDRLQPISPKVRHSPGEGEGKQKETEKEQVASTGARSGEKQDLIAVDPALPIRRYADEPSALNALVMPLLATALLEREATATSERLDLDVYERTFPFDRPQSVPLATAEAAAASFKEYGALASYFADVSHWRRIDYDWLASAEAFALQVDNLINNTSLALAIELPVPEAGGEAKVLLFVSDAQVGNWMSWDDISFWRPRDGARLPRERPSVADLLRRTTFYKVGHHGADNATPREFGLDRFSTDGELTAFVPAPGFGFVDRNVALTREHLPNMPRKELMDDLSTRTGNRVVLSDGTIWPGEDLSAQGRMHTELKKSTGKSLPAEWDSEGKLIISERPLWVQIAISY